MKPAIRCKPLDGGDVPPRAIGAENQTGQHGLAIQQNGTGAAFTELAPVLGARQVQVLTQNLEQRLVRRERDLYWLAVDDELD